MTVIAGKGSVLSIGAGGSMAAVGQLLSVETSGLSIKTFEVESLDAEDPFVIKLPTGFVDPGDITGEVFYDPDMHGGIFALTEADPIEPFTAGVSYGPDGVGAFSTKCGGIEIGTKVSTKDGVRATFKLTRSGKPL